MSNEANMARESENVPKNESAGIEPQDKNGVDGVSFTRPIPERKVDTTLLSRYEMKYLVSVSQATAIERFVRDYLPIDHYSTLVPDGYYPIVSVYLDSPDFRLCRESLTGVLNRFKLRIRSYSDDLSYPRFFEIKRRANIVIIKSRARVRTKDVMTLLSGRFVPPQSDSMKDLEALKLFQLYCSSINAFPLIRIRYLRKAYEGSENNRVRVTFDRDLCFNTELSDEVLLGGEGWRRNNVSLHGIILEIKFTGRFPVWLNRMTKYFNLRLRSMSKYTASVQNACLLGFCAPTMPFELEG